MSKPIREEMLRVFSILESLIPKSDTLSPIPPMSMKSRDAIEAIRSLIEKYGDGAEEKMKKPMKAEMLEWLIDQNCPNDPIWDEHMPVYNAILSLIEKYGDGGAKIKIMDLDNLYQDIRLGNLHMDEYFERLRSIGVQVEE